MANNVSPWSGSQCGTWSGSQGGLKDSSLEDGSFPSDSTKALRYGDWDSWDAAQQQQQQQREPANWSSWDAAQQQQHQQQRDKVFPAADTLDVMAWYDSPSHYGEHLAAPGGTSDNELKESLRNEMRDIVHTLVKQEIDTFRALITEEVNKLTAEAQNMDARLGSAQSQFQDLSLSLHLGLDQLRVQVAELQRQEKLQDKVSTYYIEKSGRDEEEERARSTAIAIVPAEAKPKRCMRASDLRILDCQSTNTSEGPSEKEPKEGNEQRQKPDEHFYITQPDGGMFCTVCWVKLPPGQTICSCADHKQNVDRYGDPQYFSWSKNSEALHCDLCRRWCTDGHLSAKEHQRRIENQRHWNKMEAKKLEVERSGCCIANFDAAEYGDEYISLQRGDKLLLKRADGAWAYGEVLPALRSSPPLGIEGWFPASFFKESS